MNSIFFFFFQAEDGIRDGRVTGVQTCALPISVPAARTGAATWGQTSCRQRNARTQKSRRGAACCAPTVRLSGSPPVRLSCPVTLLELLAAAAGTRVVAADAGVRIGGDPRSHRSGLGHHGRLPTHETIDGRLARDHGGGAAWGRPFHEAA